LLRQLTTEIESALAESRRILLGDRNLPDPTCVTQTLDGNRVILQGSRSGGAGLRFTAFCSESPESPLALYGWYQEKLRRFLDGERKANTSSLVKVEKLAITARELASDIRRGFNQSDLVPADVEIKSTAWPAQCLRELKRAAAAGDRTGVQTWADELAAATFGLADLHRWLDLVLSNHLTSLDFQSLCRTAFVWAESNSRVIEASLEPYLPVAGLTVAWGQNYLEVERQAEGIFKPDATSVATVVYLDLSGAASARWMPPELRAAFLTLRSFLSEAKQSVWDDSASAPFMRSYLVNVLFRGASAGSLDHMGPLLQRLDHSHQVLTVEELMDALFYRSGLYSSGFLWDDCYDYRILKAADMISGGHDVVAQRAHELTNRLLNGWENYAGGVMTIKQSLDIGKLDCVRGTDIIGALYRNSGHGEYFLVRLTCGTDGHSVGAVPIERNGKRRLLIVDCLSPFSPSLEWPSAYFNDLAWPDDYPGYRGPLFSAELYVRGLDGYMFAEGYVVRGPHAGQLVRSSLPYLPNRGKASSARFFEGPYPPVLSTILAPAPK
jgi:hypothetical protein